MHDKCYNNEWKAFLLPTWNWRTWCPHFDWTCQSSTRWRWRKCEAMHYFKDTKSHQWGFLLPPHQSGPATRHFQSSISVEAPLYRCPLNVHGHSSCSLSCSSNVSSHGCSPSVFPYNKFLHKKFSNFKLVTENLLSTYARDHLRSHLKYYCCMFSFFSHFCSYLQYSTAHGGRHCLLSLHNTPRNC